MLKAISELHKCNTHDQKHMRVRR